MTSHCRKVPTLVRLLPRTRLLVLLLIVLLAPAAGAQPIISLDASQGEVPEGVAVDKVGNIWVSVQPLCEVRRYTPDGQETLRLQLVPQADCIGAIGLAVDATGLLYAAVVSTDPARHGVHVVDPGRRGAAWADVPPESHHIPGSEQITSPNALAFDHHNGNLFVTDMTGGAVWRIRRDGPVELWVQHPLLEGTLPPPPGAGFPDDFRLGANGIAVRQGHVYVAVTWWPHIVRIPVNADGSAGTPEIVVDFPAFFANAVFGLDGLQLDVFGNFYVASPPGIGIFRISADGTDITQIAGSAEGVTASPLSLAFGTGRASRRHLYVTISPAFGGVGSGVVRVFAGAPGDPLP